MGTFGRFGGNNWQRFYLCACWRPALTAGEKCCQSGGFDGDISQGNAVLVGEWGRGGSVWKGLPFQLCNYFFYTRQLYLLDDRAENEQNTDYDR